MDRKEIFLSHVFTVVVKVFLENIHSYLNWTIILEIEVETSTDMDFLAFMSMWVIAGNAVSNELVKPKAKSTGDVRIVNKLAWWWKQQQKTCIKTEI